MTSKRVFLGAACCLAALAWHGGVAADTNWPQRPVTIIVPFPAGGTSDVMGRTMADGLGKVLGQPFIVENKGGAGGVVGTTSAARAQPDGYTLLFSGIGHNAIVHGLTPAPSYDSQKDFAHISSLHFGPNVLVVHPSLPANTLAEFIDYTKKHPGKVNYAVTFGASGHLSMELLRHRAGLDMMGVPYRGAAPGITALLGNEVQAMFVNQDTVLPHVQAGTLRALAVSSADRNPLFPDVPTVAESGYPGFNAVSWSGLSAPAGTPQPILDKLSAAMQQVFSQPEVRNKLEASGFIIRTSTPQEYADWIQQETTQWGKLIQDANIKPGT